MLRRALLFAAGLMVLLAVLVPHPASACYICVRETVCDSDGVCFKEIHCGEAPFPTTGQYDCQESPCVAFGPNCIWT